jgi:hypothetical protein
MPVVRPAQLPPELLQYLQPDGQTILVPLAEGLHVTVDPGGGTVVIPLDLADALLHLGPSLASIQIFSALESKTTNFEFKVIFQISTTGRTWNSAVDLCSYITANGEASQAVYGTPANFGRKMRYAIYAAAASGSAGEGGTVWLYAAFRLRT